MCSILLIRLSSQYLHKDMLTLNKYEIEAKKKTEPDFIYMFGYKTEFTIHIHEKATENKHRRNEEKEIRSRVCVRNTCVYFVFVSVEILW